MNRRLLAIAALALVPTLASADNSGPRKKGGGDAYIQIDTLNATTFRADGRRGVFTVEVGVNVPDGGLRNRAEQSMPLLHAAYSDVVRTYAAGLRPGMLPDADYLARELQRQTDRVLGRQGARLLLGNILAN